MHHSVGRIIHGGSEGITRPQRDTFLRHQGPQQSPLPQQRQHIAPNTHLRNTFNGSQNFPPAVEVDLRTSDPKIHEMYATHAHYSSLNKQKPVIQRSSAPIVGEKVSIVFTNLCVIVSHTLQEYNHIFRSTYFASEAGRINSNTVLTPRKYFSDSY
jgi:hypothetical protein